MSENPAASDWAAARGERWGAQLAGMESMLGPVDEPLIRALKLDAPWRIAEVGCGGGGTAIEILRRAPTGSVVHGFDISPSLIELARGRVGADARAIAFEVANMATASPAQPYDRLVSRLGIMFFDEPRAAFANLARWLRPGGRFAFAAWAPTSENPWMTTVRQVVARVAEIPQGDPEAPGPFRYGSADKLAVLLEAAGFAELDVHDWRGTLPIGSGLPPAEAARFALTSFSSFGEVLAKAGDAATQEAQRLLTESFSHHRKDGEVRLDACVHIFTGTRP